MSFCKGVYLLVTQSGNFFMIRNLLLFTILLFFAALQVYGQTLKGIIKDNEDNSVLSNVRIVNLTLGKGINSDQNGEYEIPVRYGDSISVNFLGYQTIEFVLKETGKQLIYRNFYLAREERLLKEFVVDNRTPYQKDSTERATTYSSALAVPWVSGVSAVFSPATALAQLFSKKAKQRHRFQVNFSKWEVQKYCASKYSPELVASLVPLTGDTLANFMNAFPIPFDFARAASDVEIKMWIKYNYLDWQKNPKIVELTPFKE